MQKHNRHPTIPIMYLHNTFKLFLGFNLEYAYHLLVIYKKNDILGAYQTSH